MLASCLPSYSEQRGLTMQRQTSISQTQPSAPSTPADKHQLVISWLCMVASQYCTPSTRHKAHGSKCHTPVHVQAPVVTMACCSIRRIPWGISGVYVQVPQRGMPVGNPLMSCPGVAETRTTCQVSWKYDVSWPDSSAASSHVIISVDQTRPIQLNWFSANACKCVCYQWCVGANLGDWGKRGADTPTQSPCPSVQHVFRTFPSHKTTALDAQRLRHSDGQTCVMVLRASLFSSQYSETLYSRIHAVPMCTSIHTSMQPRPFPPALQYKKSDVYCKGEKRLQSCITPHR
jgi:hypothetical protein